MSSERLDITELAQLQSAVAHTLRLAVGQRNDCASVLALRGNLGAGKTTFVQTLAERLGVAETVTSPTFVIMKQYVATEVYDSLVHIDAYRIESVDEMRVLGFVSLLEQKDTIICIEWADRIRELLPKNVIDLAFDYQAEERTLTIST